MIQVWEERRVFGGSGVRPFMDAVKNEAKPGRGSFPGTTRPAIPEALTYNLRNRVQVWGMSHMNQFMKSWHDSLTVHGMLCIR